MALILLYEDNLIIRNLAVLKNKIFKLKDNSIDLDFVNIKAVDSYGIEFLFYLLEHKKVKFINLNDEIKELFQLVA